MVDGVGFGSLVMGGRGLVTNVRSSVGVGSSPMGGGGGVLRITATQK